MATPRRRSARLQGNTPSRIAVGTASKLSSLLEKEESPDVRVGPSINAVLSSTIYSVKNTMPGRFTPDESGLATPIRSSESRAPYEEMHPSKIQHSVRKTPDPSLRLGFRSMRDAEEIEERNGSPLKSYAKASIKPIEESPATESKSPGFDFKWQHANTDLSGEAQRIMDSVREEAVRIKAQMQAEREEQARLDTEAEELFGVTRRKIAIPKGKAGRYSEIHKAEFRKMDSIANHASTWKNRFQAQTASSLKRSKSKAALDEDEGSTHTTKHLSRGLERGHLENTGPAKRMRRTVNDDISTNRPSTRDGSSTTPSKLASFSPTKTRLPSTLTTPTKASLARSTSVKSFKRSMIPSLHRSKSLKELVSPNDSNSNEKTHISPLKRVGSVKSILYKSQPKFSTDPTKIAAGTHLPSPIKPTFSSTNVDSPSPKRVAFASDTKAFDLTASPLLPSILKASSTEPVTYPSLSNANSPLTTKPHLPRAIRPMPSSLSSPSRLVSPTIRHVRPSGIATPFLLDGRRLPLTALPHGVASKKRCRQNLDEDDKGSNDINDHDRGDENIPPVPETPERGAKRVKSAAVGALDKSDDALHTSAKVKGKMRSVLSMGRLNALARPRVRR